MLPQVMKVSITFHVFSSLMRGTQPLWNCGYVSMGKRKRDGGAGTRALSLSLSLSLSPAL
jgi:hypothetical protein